MVVVHTFNLSTWKAELYGSLWVWGQPGLQELVPVQVPKLHIEILSRKQTNKQKQKQKTKTKNKKKKEKALFLASLPIHLGGVCICHTVIVDSTFLNNVGDHLLQTSVKAKSHCSAPDWGWWGILHHRKTASGVSYFVEHRWHLLDYLASLVQVWNVW